jgi:hypothetical protein
MRILLFEYPTDLGSIAAHVRDDTDSAGAQDAIHFCDGLHRLGEVLESGLAGPEIAGHLVRVALPELGLDTGYGSIFLNNYRECHSP